MVLPSASTIQTDPALKEQSATSNTLTREEMTGNWIEC
jgi:hypothetical protein